nr:hypothetical protein [Tanacetum cinerariifolium]
MDTTYDQQVEMDEALVPHAKRLRIGRSNFRLLSDISTKESTLQLVYDVLRLTPFFKDFLVTKDVLEIYMQEFWATTTVHHHSIRFKMNNKKHIVNLESFRDMLHICPRLPGATPPKPKASVRKTRSSSDTTVTPPTAVAGPRLSTSTKGKQLDKASKAKTLSSLSKVAMIEVQQLKLATKKSLLSTHAEEETRDEESFDPISKTPEDTDDEGNGEENLDINVGMGEGHDKEEEEDELYRDVNINQRRGIQTTQEFEDKLGTQTWN